MSQSLARALSSTLTRYRTRSISAVLNSTLSRPSHPPPPPHRSLSQLIHAVRPLPLGRFSTVRGLSDVPSPSSGDGPTTEIAPLFPGCDYQHWLIIMEKPGGEGASKDQMVDCYVQTLAKVLGSEEEAKQKIYNVSCERYFGFGCEIDEETSNKLDGIPGVLFVLPDSYVDPEHKDYGAELFVNGEIVQRSPERQRRVEPQRSTQGKPKYNDKTRYARRKEASR